MKLKITVDDRTYEVDVEASEPDLPRPAYAAQARAAPVAAPPPPVPADGAVADESKVVRVSTHPGQAIQVGDVLVVLEAMKMETNITAPVAARVAKVQASAGDAVRPGQVLVEFE